MCGRDYMWPTKSKILIMWPFTANVSVWIRSRDQEHLCCTLAAGELTANERKKRLRSPALVPCIVWWGPTIQ